MKKATLEEIKAKLKAEEERILKELSSFAHRKKPQGDDFDANYPNFGDDEDENAMEIAEYSNNLSLEKALEKALRDVKKTLERIEDGSYGVCKYCKGDIEPERLKARPTSSSCIPCKKTLTQEL